MTFNAADEEDLRFEEGYVKLEDGGARCQAETSTSGCCGGDDEEGAAGGVGGGWLWSLWWWAKLVLVVLFVAVLGAVFFKWIGPFFMDKVNFALIYPEISIFFALISGVFSLNAGFYLCFLVVFIFFLFLISWYFHADILPLMFTIKSQSNI